MAQETLEDQKELFNYQSPLSKENQTRQSSKAREKVSIRIGIDLLLALVLFVLVSSIFVYLFGVHQGKKSVEAITTTGSTLSLEDWEGSQSASNPASISAPAPSVETKATPQATTATPSKAATTTDLVNTSERETASATASAAQVTTVQTSAVTVANPWTIQLITYVGQVKANEEVKKLKAKGWDAFVIPSGKYAQLCVGKFNTKNEAERFMSEVRGLKTYSGAYVRRVKR